MDTPTTGSDRYLRTRRSKRSLLLVALAVTVAAVSSWLSLQLASGVTQLSDTSYATEFMEPISYGIGTVVSVTLSALAAVDRWHLGAAALVVTVGIQLMMMTEVVRLYGESGWSDGLEVLGYLGPFTALVVGAVLVLVCGLIGRSLRTRTRTRTRGVV